MACFGERKGLISFDANDLRCALPIVRSPLLFKDLGYSFNETKPLRTLTKSGMNGAFSLRLFLTDMPGALNLRVVSGIGGYLRREEWQWDARERSPMPSPAGPYEWTADTVIGKRCFRHYRGGHGQCHLDLSGGRRRPAGAATRYRGVYRVRGDNDGGLRSLNQLE